MNRYIKVKLLKNGVPISATLYTYKTNLDVQLGEIIQADAYLQGVIVSFVPIYEIADPCNVKAIVGQIGKEEKNNEPI